MGHGVCRRVKLMPDCLCLPATSANISTFVTLWHRCCRVGRGVVCLGNCFGFLQKIHLKSSNKKSKQFLNLLYMLLLWLRISNKVQPFAVSIYFLCNFTLQECKSKFTAWNWRITPYTKVKFEKTDMTQIDKNEPAKETDPQPYRSGSANVGAPKGMKYAFGIFMIIIYLGMGYLMMVNFFGWDESYTWARYSLGALFILYGFWRGYRQFKGIY